MGGQQLPAGGSTTPATALQPSGEANTTADANETGAKVAKTLTSTDTSGCYHAGMVAGARFEEVVGMSLGCRKLKGVADEVEVVHCRWVRAGWHASVVYHFELTHCRTGWSAS